MSLWSPLAAWAQQDFGKDVAKPGLSPYGEFFFFVLGAFLMALVVLPLTLRFPFDGSDSVSVKLVMREWMQERGSHMFGLVGGVIWSTGTWAQAMAGATGYLSFASSYAIG